MSVAGIVWLCVLAAVVCPLSGWGIVRAVRGKHEWDDLVRSIDERPRDHSDYALVINPSKNNADRIRQDVLDFFKKNALPSPMVIETTLKKDGKACAQEAIERGARVILAAGGDGTVRTVAEALAGTDRALAVIPIGTANLFAKNLGIPTDLTEALKVAVSHGSRKVDMGWMDVTGKDGDTSRHGTLLMSGIGFDATMMEVTPAQLKAALGWVAYTISSLSHLFDRKEKADITITQKDGSVRSVQNVSFRTFLIGNCGTIPVVSLMPEARFDDGLLDFELIDTRHGLLGWTNLANDVLYQTARRHPGMRPWSHGSTLAQMQGTGAVIDLKHQALAEVDGDVVGRTRHVEISVDRQALTVRVPKTA